MQKTFLKKLQALTSSKKLLIAYSGGLDSHVLLHLASQAAGYHVRAIHIHHGLQKQADSWVNHCQKSCDELNISLRTDYLNLQIKKGESVEEQARTGRYAVLKESLQADEILLTAHHQNDQAETLLLQLFRGAGVQGLAAMPAISIFGVGQHARPLLAETRQHLEDYAQVHQLKFIEDPSNQNNAFDRNFLRNEIIPQLRERWPSIDKTISRSATIQAETKQILEEVAGQDLLLVKGRDGQRDTLAIEGLLSLSPLRQKLLLRHWIQSNGFKSPSEKKLQHIFTDVINASEDAQPLLAWEGVEIRRYQGQLYILPPLLEHDNTQVIIWDNPQEALKIPSLQLTLAPLDLAEYSKPVTVRFRQGGETVSHAKRGQLSLKNMLNEAGIPPWLRSHIPLIYVGETLVKVVALYNS